MRHTLISPGGFLDWRDTANRTMAYPVDPAAAPILVQGAMNGLPTVRFRGVPGAGLKFGNSLFRHVTTFTLAAVVSRKATGSDYPRVFLNGNVNESVSIFYSPNATDVYVKFGFSDTLTGSPPPVNVVSLLEWSYDGTTREYKSNCVLVASDQPATGPPVATSDTGCIGGDQSSGFDGLIAALVLCTPALGQADALALRTYLSNRYGLVTP